MWPTSEAFRRAVRDSHDVVVRATVLRAGAELATLAVLDGQVTADARRLVRRDCTLTLVDPTGVLSVDDATSLLAPYGSEIRLERGIALTPDVVIDPSYTFLGGLFADYDEIAGAALSYSGLVATYQTVLSTEVDELVPLGVFVIVDTEIVDGPGGTVINVKGYDRSYRVQRARWSDTFVIPSGTPIGTAVELILEDRWGDADVAVSIPGTTPRLVFEPDPQSDPWKDAVDLAKAAGHDLYVDASGRFVAAPSEFVNLEPVETYEDGPDAVLLDISRALSSARVYNGVIAYGEGTENVAPVRGEAWDEDPNSPTFRYGPYGQVPYFYSSPVLQTVPQARQAARSLLSRALGTTEQIQWNQIVDPALEPGDPVRIVRRRTVTTPLDVVAPYDDLASAYADYDAVGQAAQTYAGLRRLFTSSEVGLQTLFDLDATLIIDQLTVPLSAAGAMSAAARRPIGTGGLDDEE
jgi:hypothetical protein